MSLTRRDFLHSTASALGALGGLAIWPSRARVEPLRIGLVTIDDGAPATLGARLGAEEAARAATLFGTAIAMTAAAEPGELLDARVQVLVGGATDEACEALSSLAERSAVLFLNVGATADVLRAEHCRPHTFHIAAGDAMRRAARAAAGTPDGDVRLWHESLTQYGGAQLNDRFRARFGTAMVDDAWAAWMAIKVASEAALRTGSVASASLTAYLTRPGVRFDGHKGRPLSFGIADHQLHQPLYRVHADGGDAARADEIREPASAPTPVPAPGVACGSARP